MIIAEVGHNHNANITIACQMIKAAASVGVDVIKFQLYDTDKIKKPGDTNYEELKKSELTQVELEVLYREANDANIEFLVSVFDESRFDWLDELGIRLQRHKVASRCIRNYELIEKMKETGLPIIASLGEWDEEGTPDHLSGYADFLVCQSRRDILRYGFKDFSKKSFKGAVIGFSDHTIGIEAAKSAIEKGAKIIEKHFTFNKNWRGWDQPSSATPDEFKTLVDLYRRINGGGSK